MATDNHPIRRTASRSVSFDSEVSANRERVSITSRDSPLAAPPHLSAYPAHKPLRASLTSPISPNQRKQSPLAIPKSPVSPNHRVLRRSDAVSPSATEVMYTKVKYIVPSVSDYCLCRCFHAAVYVLLNYIYGQYNNPFQTALNSGVIMVRVPIISNQ